MRLSVTGDGFCPSRESIDQHSPCVNSTKPNYVAAVKIWTISCSQSKKKMSKKENSGLKTMKITLYDRGEPIWAFLVFGFELNFIRQSKYVVLLVMRLVGFNLEYNLPSAHRWCPTETVCSAMNYLVLFLDDYFVPDYWIAHLLYTEHNASTALWKLLRRCLWSSTRKKVMESYNVRTQLGWKFSIENHIW